MRIIRDPLFQESLATTTSTARATCRCCLPRTKPTTQRLFGVANRSPYVKDGINNYVVHGQKDAVNPESSGTKASAHYQLTVGPGATQVIRLRLTRRQPPGRDVARSVRQRSTP